MDEIIQLRITLEGTDPAIWRTIQVNKEIPMIELHNTIQIAMGWKNFHLFEFNIDSYMIGIPDSEYADLEFGEEKVIDAHEVSLDNIIVSEKEEFSYEYDFGDGWRHSIIVEKILPRNASTKYPNCIAGEMNCPPEDCGGVGGYYHLLETLANGPEIDREDLLDWVGGSYDPKKFSLEETNARIRAFWGPR